MPTDALYRSIASAVLLGMLVLTARADGRPRDPGAANPHATCRSDYVTSFDLIINDCTAVVEPDKPPRTPEVVALNDRCAEKNAEGTYAGAIEDCDEAIRLDPTYATAFHNRGNAFMHLTDYDRAITDYTEAIRLNPKNERSFLARGLARTIEQDYDEAISDFKNALALDPKDWRPLLLIGNAYRGKEDDDRAIMEYTKAIERAPTSALAFANRGSAYARKRELTDALRDLNEAIRLDATLPLAFYNRSRVRHVMGDEAGSDADWAVAQGLDPLIAQHSLNGLYLGTSQREPLPKPSGTGKAEP